MKRGGPRRDWSLTHAKMAGGCRICGSPAERAHVVGREHDRFAPVCSDGIPWEPYLVAPDRIVPLCGPTPGGHHGQYDRGELDLTPYLTLPEQLQAVADAGSIFLALKRIQGRAYAPATKEAA